MTAHRPWGFRKPATCKCGHEGRSNRPEYYQCGTCYYTARAQSNEAMIRKLGVRLGKLSVETIRFKAKAADFRRRHPV